MKFYANIDITAWSIIPTILINIDKRKDNKLLDIGFIFLCFGICFTFDIK